MVSLGLFLGQCVGHGIPGISSCIFTEIASQQYFPISGSFVQEKLITYCCISYTIVHSCTIVLLYVVLYLLYRCKCLVTWFPVYDTAGYNYVTTGTYSMYNNSCTCTGSLYICDLFVHSYLKESTCLGRLIFSRNFRLFNILLYILKKESKNNVEFKIKTNSKSDHIYSLQI